MNYKELLKKAMDDKPDSVIQRSRFEIPKVTGHIEGQKTVIKNFNEIAQKFHRDPEHMLKFLLKELAAPGTFRGQQFIFGRKLSPPMINEKVAKYADQYVLCEECGKPETELSSDGSVSKLRCNACGHSYTVRTI